MLGAIQGVLAVAPHGRLRSHVGKVGLSANRPWRPNGQLPAGTSDGSPPRNGKNMWDRTVEAATDRASVFCTPTSWVHASSARASSAHSSSARAGPRMRTVALGGGPIDHILDVPEISDTTDSAAFEATESSSALDLGQGPDPAEAEAPVGGGVQAGSVPSAPLQSAADDAIAMSVIDDTAGEASGAVPAAGAAARGQGRSAPGESAGEGRSASPKPGASGSGLPPASPSASPSQGGAAGKAAMELEVLLSANGTVAPAAPADTAYHEATAEDVESAVEALVAVGMVGTGIPAERQNGSARSSRKPGQRDGRNGAAVEEGTRGTTPLAGSRKGKASARAELELDEVSISSDDPSAARAPGQKAGQTGPKRKRALFATSLKLGRVPIVKRVLGPPDPADCKMEELRSRTARVRERVGQVMRDAQQSALAEVISSSFFILFPLTIGVIVYSAVGQAVSELGPAPPPPSHVDPIPWWQSLSESWQHWMISDQAAGAAGAFAGFAGVGIAAKTAAPAAALVTSSVTQVDTLWRSFGGASLVALYWKTLVFGKTLRAVEWDLAATESPEGKMHSFSIRVPSLSAVKTKIAAENGLKDASCIQQLALWMPSSGDFLEPLRQAKDLSLVPELGFIVWTTVPESQVPFPPRGNLRGSSKAAKQASESERSLLESVAMIQTIVDEANRRDQHLTAATVPPTPGQGLLVGMTEQERGLLVSLAAKEDRGLHILFRAFGPTPTFVQHALLYMRSCSHQQPAAEDHP